MYVFKNNDLSVLYRMYVRKNNKIYVSGPWIGIRGHIWKMGNNLGEILKFRGANKDIQGKNIRKIKGTEMQSCTPNEAHIK